MTDDRSLADQDATTTDDLRFALRFALLEALRHFVHLDESNAAIHCGDVRYSPLTFRLAECLHDLGANPADAYIRDVLAHVGRYEEDKGR